MCSPSPRSELNSQRRTVAKSAAGAELDGVNEVLELFVRLAAELQCAPGEEPEGLATCSYTAQCGGGARGPCRGELPVATRSASIPATHPCSRGAKRVAHDHVLWVEWHCVMAARSLAESL